MKELKVRQAIELLYDTEFDCIERKKYFEALDTIIEALYKAGYSVDPECYVPNDNPYPLCIGNGSEKCHECSIYENLEMYHEYIKDY